MAENDVIFLVALILLGEGNNICAAVLLNKHATANVILWQQREHKKLCTRKNATNDDVVIELKR